MAISAKEFYEGILNTAGVSTEKRQALLAALADEDIARALTNDAIAPRLRQDEFSRKMDEAKAERERAVAEREKSTKYYADLLQWKAGEEAKLEAALAGAAGDTDPARRQLIQQVQSMDDFQKTLKSELDRRDQLQISLLKDGMHLASQHVYEFKEPLDSEALARIATEKGLSLKQAYDEMVGPRRMELSKVQRDTELAKAREEGARDALSKHKIPIDTTPREYHVMLDRDPSKQVGVNDYVPNSGKLSPTAERQLRDNFVNEWNTAPAGATSGT